MTRARVIRRRHGRGHTVETCAASSSSAPPVRSARRRSTSSAANPRPFRGGRARGRLATARCSPRRRPSSASSTPRVGVDEAVQLVRDVDADVVLNGITGSVGLAPTLAALETRHARSRSPTRSRSSSAATSSRALAAPGPDRAGRLRALGDRAGAALGRPTTRCAGSCSPHPAGRSAAARRDVARRRDPRRGARAPDLGHGPRRHDELGDAREQGPRGHRGAPAVRRRRTTASTSSCTRSRSCTRWSSSSTARRSPRRLRPTCGCRSRSGSTGRTGSPASGGRSTGRPRSRGPSSRSTPTAFPAVALAKQVGRAGGTYPAVFNAANEQAVAAFHAGRIGFLGDRRHRARRRGIARGIRSHAHRGVARRRRTGGPPRRRRAHRRRLR